MFQLKYETELLYISLVFLGALWSTAHSEKDSMLL